MILKKFILGQTTPCYPHTFAITDIYIALFSRFLKTIWSAATERTTGNRFSRTTTKNSWLKPRANNVLNKESKSALWGRCLDKNRPLSHHHRRISGGSQPLNCFKRDKHLTQYMTQHTTNYDATHHQP